MTDILRHIHQYVPGHNDGNDATIKPVPTLSGGDYLTHERHIGAQSGVSNGITPSKKLLGLISKFEEFHNQAEVLLVSDPINIWIIYTKHKYQRSCVAIGFCRVKNNDKVC